MTMSAQPTIFSQQCDVICFAPYRWAEAGLGTRQLMEKLSSGRQLFYVGPPLIEAGMAFVECVRRGPVLDCIPHLPLGSEKDIAATVRTQLQQLISGFGVRHYIAWYLDNASTSYTPMPEPELRVGYASELRSDDHLDDEWLREADIVLFTQPALSDEVRAANENARLVPSTRGKDSDEAVKKISGIITDRLNMSTCSPRSMGRRHSSRPLRIWS